MRHLEPKDKPLIDLTMVSDNMRIQMLENDVSQLYVIIQDLQMKIAAMAQIGGWDE